MKDNCVSIFGLGKLGLPMACVFGNKGYNVIGVDCSENIVEDLMSGKIHIEETGLDEIRDSICSDVEFTTDGEYAVYQSQVSFIIVPTPSGKDNAFINDNIERVLAKIGRALKRKNEYHIVVITSTVMPTSCAKFKALLENVSQKEAGVDFGLCYSPEFVALGSVIHDMTHPDSILIGEYDHKDGDVLAEILLSVCENSPEIHRMSCVNAEIAKLSLNVALTNKITLANTIAEVCEQFPGGDANKVASFVGSDSRIGKKLMKGALGFGGPCLPRDNQAFIKMAKDRNVCCPIQKETVAMNTHFNKRIVEYIESVVQKGEKIAVLGMTYKTNTDVIEKSASLEIIKQLVGDGYKVMSYDPTGTKRIATAVKSAEECITDAACVVVATPWEEFKYIQYTNRVVVDCWGILDRSKIDANVTYKAIGKGIEF